MGTTWQRNPISNLKRNYSISASEITKYYVWGFFTFNFFLHQNYSGNVTDFFTIDGVVFSVYVHVNQTKKEDIFLSLSLCFFPSNVYSTSIYMWIQKTTYWHHVRVCVRHEHCLLIICPCVLLANRYWSDHIKYGEGCLWRQPDWVSREAHGWRGEDWCGDACEYWWKC